MSEEEIHDRFDHYNIPTDLPLVVQVSRFDRWKDPEGVIQAFRIARKEVDATLVLLGNVATDDPEGTKVYESLLDCREERIIISHRAVCYNLGHPATNLCDLSSVGIYNTF